MKTIMLGCGMIGAWEYFAKYREFFVDIIKLYYDRYDRKQIK